MFQNPPGGRKRRPKITSPKQPLTTHIHTPNRAVRSWLKIGLQLGVVIVLGNMQEFQRFWKLDRWLTQKDLGCGVFFCFGVFFSKEKIVGLFYTLRDGDVSMWLIAFILRVEQGALWVCLFHMIQKWPNFVGGHQEPLVKGPSRFHHPRKKKVTFAEYPGWAQQDTQKTTVGCWMLQKSGACTCKHQLRFGVN